MNYLELLENSYAQTKECQPDSEMGRLEYLAEYIFMFTTYENIVSSLMANKCLEVCRAITDRKTFGYIGNEDGNLWYLIMVNMPFFEGKLEWGTSIRGAWWELYGSKKFKVQSCGLYEGYDQLLDIEFNSEQWAEFILAMEQFAALDNPAG